MKEKLFAWLILAAACVPIAAQDTLSRWSIEGGLGASKVLATDQYVKKWLQRDASQSLSLTLTRATLPQDSSLFARDYGYPRFSLTMRFTRSDATMHRSEDPAWGQLVPVDYPSHLGNSLSLYGTFTRPLFRSARWEAGYQFSMGFAWLFKKYSKVDNIDDELIGQHLNIYFGAALYAQYRLSNDLAARLSADFYHHSNGALNRPNKGANHFGPMLSMVYYLGVRSKEVGVQDSGGRIQELGGRSQDSGFRIHEPGVQTYLAPRTLAPRTSYLEMNLSLGAKTLNEDWQKTQFNTPPSSPDYRRASFRVYPTFSTSLAWLYRYARRWSSGIGADLFYGSYASHVERLDKADGFNERHSPWSFGLSARHNAYYGNLSLRMAVGAYLYRHMGHNAKETEKPYYETIGLHYSVPRWNGLTFGVDVKAHLTKADYTALTLSYPIHLK